jgi:hypothetical protein
MRSAGKEKILSGIPSALEKDETSNGNGELVLVINNDDMDIRIPLAKINMIRRIKKSIFET